MKKYDVIVIGGGAAGFFAAINCAIRYSNYSIAILEKNNKVLQKVLISGGGRCNVTNNTLDNKLLVQNYPRGKKELLSVFNSFDVHKLLAWFHERNVPLKIEADGRVFPTSDSSQTIIDCFIQEKDKLGIDLLLLQKVKHTFKHESHFEIICEDNEYTAKYVIVTVGGFNKLEHYHWLTDLGHHVVSPIPSLFTFNIEKHEMQNLMGVSMQGVSVKIIESKNEMIGDILITHWGFSGPVILKLSAFAAKELHALDYNYNISVNWINVKNTDEVRMHLIHCKDINKLKNLENALPYALPKRLWLYFIEQIGVDANLKWAELPNKKINVLVELLCNSRYLAQGKTTNKEEFVTSGGIDLKDVDMKTLESKKNKGMYFAGEVLNIDGVTGGFNFQSAWSTGFIAAQLGKLE